MQEWEKRILIVTPDPNAGGSSKSMLPIVKHLKNSGYEILVVISKEGFVTNSLKSLGIKYNINPYIVLNVWPRVANLHDVVMYVPKLVRYFCYSILSVLKLYRITKKFNPNLIYSNSSLIICGYKVAKKMRLPHIWHIRDYGNMDFGLTFFPSNRYKAELMSNSPSISITKGIHDYYHLQQIGKIIYNGIKSRNDIKDSLTASEKIAKPYLLYVGGISENKGCTDLVKAFCKYRDEGGTYDLIICGSEVISGYTKHLNSVLHKNPDILNHVFFKGQVSNVDHYMQYAMALIVPSKYEAFGRITSEAMFNRCLIVGRNTGGTKEQLDLGLEQTGHEIGLRFNTVDELTARMHEVESMNQSVRNSYILPAYQTAIDNFTIENYTTRVREYIEHIIATPTDTKTFANKQ